ncbi:chemotaxis protein CheW [Kineosporia sp. J2-2]|uniref:Chemotaxis protein CheW n=1 Tax=Kineosporia corallincola TaxID=2835133 RepID=A0ABS5TJY1_9ACTN|nr:chemotaxis protein CheW [Kineosporia corallincola]MBT0771381.1 chemotaxis protein CheW [Kineosporia corallincola]
MTQLSTFHVGSYLFGVEVALVQEVVRMQTFTPVPLAPPEVAGLINLRGEVLTAIDVRARLGLPPSGSERPQVNVVVRVDDEPVSLLVDEIGGVVEVSQIPFESTPSTVDAQVGSLLLGAYTMPEKLLLALDARALLAFDESRTAAA